MNHVFYMQRAMELSQNNRDLPFGALLVDSTSGRIVAEGWNRSGDNPTWHGEIDVINRYAAEQVSYDWSDLSLYTTAEPCPMCAGAILWTGIQTVVYGTSIGTLIEQGWSQIDIRVTEMVDRTPDRELRVVGGILEGECDRLFAEARRRLG